MDNRIIGNCEIGKGIKYQMKIEDENTILFLDKNRVKFYLRKEAVNEFIKNGEIKIINIEVEL